MVLVHNNSAINCVIVVIVYTYFRACIHLMFKHIVLGSRLSCLDCLSKIVS